MMNKHIVELGNCVSKIRMRAVKIRIGFLQFAAESFDCFARSGGVISDF